MKHNLEQGKSRNREKFFILPIAGLLFLTPIKFCKPPGWMMSLFSTSQWTSEL